jgi:hypothetical protein
MSVHAMPTEVLKPTCLALLPFGAESPSLSIRRRPGRYAIAVGQAAVEARKGYGGATIFQSILANYSQIENSCAELASFPPSETRRKLRAIAYPARLVCAAIPQHCGKKSP